MSYYVAEMDAETGLLPPYASSARGKELAPAYVAADPFPHIVIDGFLPPPVVERVLRDFPVNADDATVYDRDQERFKSQYLPDTLEPWSRQLFYSFNSRPFIQMLENITGIKGLVPDPYFFGAGLHEIHPGGHLSIHADFNHHKPLNLQRRINVLIYLNKDWADDYGGQLELWRKDMSACVHSILPAFNRCVIFNTTENSNHGNPHPITHPAGVSRKSIALYYYTATWDGLARDYTTQFRVRPGSGDAADKGTIKRELIEDIMPPRLLRGWRKVKSQLRSRA